MVEAGPAELARRAAAHVVLDDLSAHSLTEDDARHLGSVLRLRQGEAVSGTDGRGGFRMFSWAEGGALEPSGEVVRLERAAPSLCVGFAPVKGDRNDWAVQKLAELGVDRIVLLRSDRGVVRWDEQRAQSQVGRLRRIARQAIMQSRGVWLPSVEGVVDLQSAVGDEGVEGGSGVALADPDGAGLSERVTTVLVGPEGGWSEEEWGSFSTGAVRVGAGVLRTESAAVAAGVLMTAIRAGLVSPAVE